MGLMSALGKIGSIALDFVPGAAAAKTGVKIAKGIAKGASAAGDISSVAGKQQEGEANGKVTQAKLQQAQDALALNKYQTEQGAQFTAGNQDLARKQFTTADRGDTAKQALVSALLSGKIDPVNITGGGGKSTGGILAALQNNPEALAAMKTLHGSASAAQNTPLDFAGGNLLTAPKLTALPQVNSGGIMSNLTKIGQLFGAASPYLQGNGADDGGNGASKPQSAVDVMGANPGGAIVPRTVDPRLRGTDYSGWGS
jgi:hypothetical protein